MPPNGGVLHSSGSTLPPFGSEQVQCYYWGGSEETDLSRISQRQLARRRFKEVRIDTGDFSDSAIDYLLT